MNIAFWTPLPPERSGIADYSAELLAELRDLIDVTVIIRDQTERAVCVPDGVKLCVASRFDRGQFDLSVYQMGNNPPFHAFMHKNMLRDPGLVVLHDPSLVDFYMQICGDINGAVFREEVTFNCPEIGASDDLPRVRLPNRVDLDRMQLLMSRRIAEANILTLVHSAFVRDEMRRRFPTARIERIQLAAAPIKMLDEENKSDVFTFGVFGGIAYYKRALEVVRAFEQVHSRFANIRLLVAGRSDDLVVEKELRALADRPALNGSIVIETDLELAELEQRIGSCDVAISLRWPTAGEMSATLMRALSAGRPVIVSDVPQFRELDQRFCIRIPITEPDEHVSLVEALTRFAAFPGEARVAGEHARKFVQEHATYRAVAEQYVGHLTDCIARVKNKQIPKVVDPTVILPPGVNAIGSWNATTGIAVAARGSVIAAAGAGVEVAVENYRIGADEDDRRFPREFRRLKTGRPYPIDLNYININEMDRMPAGNLGAAETGRKVIASWHWELPRLPRAFLEHVAAVDEIWVASRFVRDAFAHSTDKPIVVMPPVVEATPSGRLTRLDFGIPPNAFVFMFHFDAHSTFARKNPFAVIEAFRRAFPRAQRGRDRVLVIKCLNLADLPIARALLTDSLATVGGVLLEDEMNPVELASLIESCDSYVSLHRSEGFGLGMAEAMALGKPVIATAFSGNVDFLDRTNGCPVRYQRRTIEAGDLYLNPEMAKTYAPGQVWAEPDLDDAARWMRWLVDNPGGRAKLGEEARRAISEKYARKVVGQAIRERLDAFMIEHGVRSRYDALVDGIQTRIDGGRPIDDRRESSIP